MERKKKDFCSLTPRQKRRRIRSYLEKDEKLFDEGRMAERRVVVDSENELSIEGSEIEGSNFFCQQENVEENEPENNPHSSRENEAARSFDEHYYDSDEDDRLFVGNSHSSNENDYIFDESYGGSDDDDCIFEEENLNCIYLHLQHLFHVTLPLFFVTGLVYSFLRDHTAASAPIQIHGQQIGQYYRLAKDL